MAAGKQRPAGAARVVLDVDRGAASASWEKAAAGRRSSTSAQPMKNGTIALNAERGQRRQQRRAGDSAQRRGGAERDARRPGRQAPPDSRCAPDTPPATSPTGSRRSPHRRVAEASGTGKVISVPLPTSVLIAPAAAPPTRTRRFLPALTDASAAGTGLGQGRTLDLGLRAWTSRRLSARGERTRRSPLSRSSARARRAVRARAVGTQPPGSRTRGAFACSARERAASWRAGRARSSRARREARARADAGRRHRQLQR